MIKDFNKTAIISGEYNISYTELLQRIFDYSKHTPKGIGAKTLILSENREGWIYAFFSIWQNKGIAVPVDATSTVHDIAYIIKDCKPEFIWTSRKKADTAIEAIKEAGLDIPVMLIDDFEHIEIGNSPKADIQYKLEDTAVIIYTSGTTGSPKGVMLSFDNLLANIHSVAVEVPIFTEDRRTLILLPLHHVLPLQGTVIAPILYGGGVIICPSMSAADIMGSLQKGKVAIIVGVPRLWQTLFNAMKAKINANAITRGLFNLCESVGSRTLSRLVFKSVRTKMGGHIKYCVSGGAALDKEIGKGLKTLGLDVLEGYGMTEAAPIIAFTRPDDIKPGCVGLPLPSTQVEIREGEICAKGKNIMQGYYNRPEETAAILKDGWLHTGDLGKFDEKGRLYITGRTKEIIVLSNGKNINPSELEYKIEKYGEYVKEAAVLQDGDMLRAIIVPQPAWAMSKSDDELEQQLKRNVLEPYNQTVASYKKVMSLFVYKGELPRTKLDKIQRFKLKDIIKSGVHTAAKTAEEKEPSLEEYKILKQYIVNEKKCEVHPSDNIETDLAFDSLDKVGLQDFIEQSFGMEISAERITSFRNIREMAEYVSDFKTRIEVEKTDWHKLLNESSPTLQLPANWHTMNVFAWMFRVFFKIYFKLKAKGTENIPENGPFIIAPNHQSFFDGVLVTSFLRSSIIRQTYFFAKEKHVNNPFLRYMASKHNIIIVEQSNLKDSIKKLSEVLRLGKNIIIFPEGTRTTTGKLGEFKKTFAILSQELNIPIIPVCIKGAYESMPKGAKWARPHKVKLQFMPPVMPEKNDQDYDKLTDEVHKVINNALNS